MEIPIDVIDRKSHTISAFIHFAIQSTENNIEKKSVVEERIHFDKIECLFFELNIEGDIFKADKPQIDFEISLLQICKKIKGKYLLKCCFGCLYSDYSPYGNDFFATMLCYSSVAERYLHVFGKYRQEDMEETIPIWDVYSDGEQRQETFLCDKFKPRLNCLGGYRGTIY